MPLVSRTRATLRSAEFGFFGVVVYTRVQTPRRCGAAIRFLRPWPDLRPGVETFFLGLRRPFRTSWLMLGMRRVMVATVVTCAGILRACAARLGGRPHRSERRRRERGRHDHEHEGEALEHDSERVARHRVAEHEDAAADRRDVGRGTGEGDDGYRLALL